MDTTRLKKYLSLSKWYSNTDKEKWGVYIAALTLMLAIGLTEYNTVLEKVLHLAFGCQIIYIIYRWIRPKKLTEQVEKPTGPIYKAGINQMKGTPRVNGKKGFK